MEDLHMNNTSQNNNDHDSNITFYNYDYDYKYSDSAFIVFVMTWTIISIGLPLTLMATYVLFSQVRNDHVAPIYVINLLISDLIQFCCMIVDVAQPEDDKTNIVTQIYIYCVGASVCFMVCIALERYLVIACPLWYRFRRTIKISVLVCVVGWVLPLVCIYPSVLGVQYEVSRYIFAVFFLLPFPLLIFFLGGTLRALSASISVPTDEKQRIVGMLALVLLIYTLLFLPGTILLFVELNGDKEILYYLFPVFHRLSPLADLVLYVFMRKGAIDRLLVSASCCRMDSNESRSPAVYVVTCPQSA